MKRHILFSLLFLVLMCSCSSGGDDPTPEPDPGGGNGGGTTENQAPSVPELIDPTNNKLCIDKNLVFNWEASTDPEGDAVKYAMEVSKNSGFTQITHAFTNLTETTRAISLEAGQAYYWRVKSIDSKNKSSEYSAVYQFYTEGVAMENHLPFSPSLILPEQGVTVEGSSVELIWGSTDVDNDSLTFDVYMDTNNNPTTEVKTGHLSKSLLVSDLLPNTTYYWKVVVSDGRGGIAKGQIWSFKTQ